MSRKPGVGQGVRAMGKPGPKHTYDFPRPALTVDVVVVSGDRHVLLIERKSEPYSGMWAIPGGFVEPDEGLSEAARRELIEETGITVGDMEQLVTMGTPGRDPRGWTVSVCFLTRLVGRKKSKAGDDASAAKWFPLDSLPPLAFDHAVILGRAVARMTDRAE